MGVLRHINQNSSRNPGEVDRQTDRQRQTDGLTDRQTDGDRQIYRQTDRDKQTDGQTDIQREMGALRHINQNNPEEIDRQTQK